ncbi:hypothetical protein JXB41_06580 [Candidatus Woesearchaeota archaeon]|nr:hypothetical protein [Candidatus Woesearchaeota archaeon]
MKLKKPKKSNKWNITKEFLTNEYLKEKKSILKISKETGINYRTLYWYKKKFGLSTHPNALYHKGKHRSPKTEFKKGQKPWNAGRKGVMPIPYFKGKKLSKEYKKKISIATKKAMQKPEVQSKVKKTQFKKGITPWNKGKTGVYSKEIITQIRKARLKQIFPKHSTNIEIILFSILKELKIEFKKHKKIKMICQADAFIEPNIVLFADGDYWHCNPRIYKKPKTKAQIKNIKRDKEENYKLIKEGFIVKRFWGYDLKNKREECKEIIGQLNLI